MKVAIVYNKKTIDENDVINIFGMSTKEHYSEKTVEKVAKSLEKGGHSVKIIEGGMNLFEDMKDFMPKVVSGDRPGMVFNMAYGIQGQNRYTHVPAMLEMLGIPYVGSGPETHAVVQDKVMTKIVLQKNKLPTPGFWVFSTSDDEFDDLIFPVIVKPKMESTSMGMEVVDNWDDLRKAVAKQIEKFSQEILVEQFIPGREFAVGLLGNGNNVEILPVVEMDLDGDPNRIQTITEKKSKPVDKICPAPLTQEQTDEVKRICISAFRKLGLNDFTRVDLRMDKDGNFYILELNSMASLGVTGSYYAAADGLGFLYNNYMSAFERENPNHPFYLRPNSIPWTSVCPSIIFYNHEPWMVLGTPGSARIFSTLSHFISRVIDHNNPIDQAMEKPRIHCSVDGKISLEADDSLVDIIKHLKKMGYKIDIRERYSFFLGAVHAVLKRQTGEGFQGVAEVRRDGTAEGLA